MRDILIPALVAAVVTLVIEYAAKPSLEARKDRLLDEARRRREVVGTSAELAFHLGQLKALSHLTAQDPVRESREQEVVEQIRSKVCGLEPLTVQAAGVLNEDELQAAGLLNVAWLGYLHHRAASIEQAEAYLYDPLDLLVQTAADVLETPRHRAVRRRRLMRRLRRTSALNLAAAEEAAESGSTRSS